MNIPAKNGKSYEVRATSARDRFEVLDGGTVVGDFRLGDDDTEVTVRDGRTPSSTLREVADEFVDRGGAPMRAF